MALKEGYLAAICIDYKTDTERKLRYIECSVLILDKTGLISAGARREHGLDPEVVL